MDKKLESKLSKLLKLAEQGIGGEKDNAERQLAALLKRHNLSLTDISDEHTETHWFTYKNSMERKLIKQIIWSVLGDKEEERDFWKRKNKKSVGVDLTKGEMLEIELKYGIYRKSLSDQIDVFYSAFVNKNHIFPDSDGSCEDPELTAEEKARAFQVMQMMNGIDKAKVRKALPEVL